MKEYIPLITVFVSGLFSLLVTLVTVSISNRKEDRRLTKDDKRVKYDKLENVYADTVALFEKVIRYVEHSGDVSDLWEQMSRSNSRLSLLASQEVRLQTESLSAAVFEWSAAYNRAKPKNIGDSGYAAISSNDLKFNEKARELYPSVNDGLVKLIALMREHLQKIEP